MINFGKEYDRILPEAKFEKVQNQEDSLTERQSMINLSQLQQEFGEVNGLNNDQKLIKVHSQTDRNRKTQLINQISSNGEKS